MKTASTEHLKCNELYFRIISLEFLRHVMGEEYMGKKEISSWKDCTGFHQKSSIVCIVPGEHTGV